jgi:invasion protein IalB
VLPGSGCWLDKRATPHRFVELASARARYVFGGRAGRGVGADDQSAKSRGCAFHRARCSWRWGGSSRRVTWAKLCTKNDQTGNKQICLVEHGGLDPDSGIVVGTAAVRTVEGEDKQTLLVGLTTNYSLVIPVGVQIKIDDSEPILLKDVGCLATNCQAQMELTKENFEKMRKGKHMIVAAINMQQKRMGFPVPLTGLGNAYDGPPADNAKYEEAWRQLMEKSRQRQIELANKLAEQQKEQAARQPQAGAPPQDSVQIPAQPPAH